MEGCSRKVDDGSKCNSRKFCLWVRVAEDAIIWHWTVEKPQGSAE